ncbi:MULTISPECIES: DUF4169 family protein [unclassified Sphingomonas]|uniref:DUF4169 family protein n=1 Tax=unclassified Sphingomonas TaxID=196159 RepID=UPI000E76E4F9|nr:MULTISPECIES: DUF4169 family protein [unclassified Sphingomonas]RKE47518.1 uncharacterized protein DUF4169 [Sphingomonas sp. PP-CC-1A-547]TCM07287.1 uncharacterized protein DUF4169 [Sphingomonas sp. PP-CC-3G-468]
MGDVINLRLVRKRRARDEASSTADRNRKLFGRTTAQQAADAAAKTRIERALDGARLDSTSDTFEE